MSSTEFISAFEYNNELYTISKMKVQM